MFSRFDKTIVSVFFLITNTIRCSNTYFTLEQCPGTDVSNIRHQTQFFEISMIFYYTQWSDESLDALQQYNDVAEFFGDKVYSAAIDCRNLACNCSKALATTVGSGLPHKWPTLMVYYGSRAQMKIQYNGLYTFRDILQFVENVMQPLERIRSEDDMGKMNLFADAVVVGIFKKPTDFEYKQFLIASLKWLEHDPIRTYRFAVSFNSSTIEDKLNDTNNVAAPKLLIMGYKTKKSFENFEWKVNSILRYLHEELNNDYNKLHGYTTPIMIAQKIKKQPVLAIFVNQPQNFFSYMEKHVDSQQSFTRAINTCNKLKKKNTLTSWNKSLTITRTLQSIQIFTNDSKCHYDKRIIMRNLGFYYAINEYLKELFKKSSCPDLFKSANNPNLEIHEILSFFRSTSCLQNNNIALQTRLHIGIVKRLESYLANEKQCKNSNRTLSVLLNTKRYKDYLENIDIEPNSQSMATAFIADNANEYIYLMEDRFAIYNLMEFVKKFYANSLNNYFKNENIFTTSFSSSFSRKPSYDIEMKYLNRHMFLNYLQYAHNQTLIVLIYSPDCTLCSNIQHSFIQLSLSLRHVVELKFLRINAMANDLPWQYNMPFLPALLVFPESRFSESRLFPMHLKPDVRNVFGFILNQLSALQQVRLVLAVCQSGTLPFNHSQNCWHFAKTILMQHIGKHLQYWQMFETERSLIFERLRAFKDMSLDIQRNLRL